MKIRIRPAVLVLIIILIINYCTYPVPGKTSNVQVKQEELVDLYFKEAEVRDVLRAIAELAEVNLITDGSVSGTITVRLDEISFQEALDLITTTNNLDYYWKGNAVIVASPDRINQLSASYTLETVVISNHQPELIKDIIGSFYVNLKIGIDPLHHQLILSGRVEEVSSAINMVKQLDLPLDDTEKSIRIIKINYAELAHIKELIENLFQEIVVQLEQSKRMLVIKGEEKRVEQASQLINQLDQPRSQVMIEARIEEISQTELKDVGVSPDQLSQLNFITEQGLIDGIQLTWPELLRVLENKGTARLLANPSLLTVNGEQASLVIGDRIPVKVEQVKEGKITSSIDYIDAGIVLEFEPWVTEDDYINLKIHPRVSSIGETIAGNLPAINTREAETMIILKDGQTLAIGGLLQDDLLESLARVPVLSQIPLFGEIFKQRKVNNIKTEVIIFITPRIIKRKKQASENLSIRGVPPSDRN